MNTRHIGLLTASIGIAFGLIAAPPAWAAEVNVMGYNARFAENYMKVVVEPFMKKTGIKVNYYPALHSADELAILRAQKAKPQHDISIMDTSIARSANLEGLFVKPDRSVVTNIAELDDQATPNGEWGPGLTFDYFAILYDTQRVSTAPTALADLWKPEFKGQIAWNAAPAMDSVMTMIVLNKSLGGDYTKTVQPAITKLAQLSPSVQTWSPTPDVYTLVMNGTAKVGVGWNAFARYYATTSNGRLGVAVPAEGTIFQINTINQVANGPNPKEAAIFMNYALSPEAQKALSDVMAYAPTNKKAALTGDALSQTAASPAIRAKVVPLDWTIFMENRDKWVQQWRREILSAN
jgi:putative spermidine/putrescine transport system substrate-binding protein